MMKNHIRMNGNHDNSLIARMAFQGCMTLVVAGLTLSVAGPVHAQSPNPVPTDDSLRAFWESKEFKAKFLGTYGVASEIEPKFVTPEEQTFYAELRTLIFDNPAQAIAQLRQKISPQSSATLDFTLGALLFQEGQTAEATASYEKALEKFPSFRRAHRNLGITLARENQYEKAIRSLTKTIQLGDADGLLYGLLGVCYAGLERHFPAEAAFRNAIISEPDSMDWQIGLVKSYLAQEKFIDAEKLLDSLLAANPDSEKLMGLQVNVLVQLERYTDAQVNLEILKDLGKAQPNQLFLLGDLYLNENRNELASEAYTQALAGNENPSPERIIRAVRGFIDRGSFDTAGSLIARIRSAYGSNLSDKDSVNLLKQEAKMAVAQDRNDAVMAYLTQILEKDPLDGEALLMAGDFHNANGDVEKAMFRYETAAKIDGFQSDGLVKQAQLFVQKSDYRKALTLLKKAQEINPRDSIKRYLENIERLARAASS